MFTSPHVLGHSADLLRVERDCAAARPGETAAASGQAARGTGGAAIAVRLDHRLSVARRSGGRLARLGARIHRRTGRLGNARALQALADYSFRRSADRYSAMAESATHGAVDKPVATTAAGSR